MGDGHALRRAGRTGREDDPRVVAGGGCRALRSAPRRWRQFRGLRVRPQHVTHAGLAEDGGGTLLGVVGVDRHIGRSAVQDCEDRKVQLRGTRRNADSHPVSRADALRGEPACTVSGLGAQLTVGQHLDARVKGRCVGVSGGGGLEDGDEGAGRGGCSGMEQGFAADRFAGRRGRIECGRRQCRASGVRPRRALVRLYSP